MNDKEKVIDTELQDSLVKLHDIHRPTLQGLRFRA